MKVRFTPSARQQYLHGLTYIRKDKSPAARNLRQRTERILRRLENYPHFGRPIPEFADREVVIRPYYFFYRGKRKQSGLLWFGITLKTSIPLKI